MTELRIGYVVHGMAVSDFTKGYLIEREQLAGELAAALQEAIRRENGSLQPEEMERIIGRVLEQPARARGLSGKSAPSRS
jgi:hypothetical protein